MTLTPRQASILEHVVRHIEEFGRPPSVRETALHFGIRSPNGVICHFRALQRKGLVRFRTGRLLELVGVRFQRVPAS
jgi:repressor LexA